MIWLALLSAAAFAAGLLLTQRGLRYLPPLRGAGISVPTTLLLMLMATPVTIDWSLADARGALVFAAIGLLFPAAVTLLTFEANRRIGASLTGALGNTTPVFALVFAFLTLGEVPHGAQFAAVAVILAGMALLAGGVSLRGATGIGLLLPVTAAAVRGLVQPAVKYGMGFWPNPFAASLLGYAVSATLLLGLGLAAGQRVLPPTNRGTLWFIATGIANGIAVTTLYAALARGPVAVVAPLIACYPVMVLGFSAALPGAAVLTPRMVAGVGITVLGVVLLLAL